MVVDTPEQRLTERLRRSLDDIHSKRLYEMLGYDVLGTSAVPAPQEPITWEKLEETVKELGKPLEYEPFPWPMEIKMDKPDQPIRSPFIAYGYKVMVKPVSNPRIPYSRHRSKRIYKKLLKRFGPQWSHLPFMINATA